MNWHDKILRSIELHVICMVHGNSKKNDTIEKVRQYSQQLGNALNSFLVRIISLKKEYRNRIKKARDCAQPWVKETDLSLFCTWFENTLIWILCCSGLVFVIAHSQHSSQTSDERVSSGKTKYINSSHVAPSQHCSKNLLLPRSSFAVTLFLLFVVVVMYREISKLTLVFTLQLLNEVVDITWIEIEKKHTFR